LPVPLNYNALSGQCRRTTHATVNTELVAGDPGVKPGRQCECRTQTRQTNTKTMFESSVKMKRYFKRHSPCVCVMHHVFDMCLIERRWLRCSLVSFLHLRSCAPASRRRADRRADCRTARCVAHRAARRAAGCAPSGAIHRASHRGATSDDPRADSRADRRPTAAATASRLLRGLPHRSLSCSALNRA
jgi:hypothetical protein